MNMEQMGGFSENNSVAIGNQMQMQLAAMHGEDLGVFVEKRAEEFRNVINNHPEFLKEYEEEPEIVLGKIESFLYH